ncbi:MAG: hypothetical protein K6F87_03360 [Lachnospiraceae bacterium]|nr:hypothetical protein [Lachnospiraceae bacterium]
MRRRLTTIVSILAATLIMGLILTGCKDDKDASKDTNPEVSQTSPEETVGDTEALRGC